MRNLNLKEELPNIRNTLKPSKSRKGLQGVMGQRKKIITIAGLAVFVLVMGWTTGLWQSVFSDNYADQTRKPDLVAQSKGDNRQRPSSRSMGNFSNLSDPSLAAPDEQNGRQALMADSNEAAPDEGEKRVDRSTLVRQVNNSKAVKQPKVNVSGQSQLTQSDEDSANNALSADDVERSHDKTKPSLNSSDKISFSTASATPTRPVAADAKAPKEPALAKIKVYRVRFALCIYKNSCEQVKIKLQKSGVGAHLARSTATLLIHKVIAGPWSTKAHAMEASNKIGKTLVNASIITSDKSYYLMTGPYPNIMAADEAHAKIGAMGYKTEQISKKESIKVYKVYEGAYKNKSSALKRQKYFVNKGFGCIVELSD